MTARIGDVERSPLGSDCSVEKKNCQRMCSRREKQTECAFPFSLQYEYFITIRSLRNVLVRDPRDIQEKYEVQYRPAAVHHELTRNPVLLYLLTTLANRNYQK
jgi:hypothetical protein